MRASVHRPDRHPAPRGAWRNIAAAALPSRPSTERPRSEEKGYDTAPGTAAFKRSSVDLRSLLSSE